jgi:L-iditol 2-dehydrogenase
MKVIRFHAPGDVRVEDAPDPVPGPGDVKIRVRSCSTCGTDVKIFRFGHHHIVPATGFRSSRPSPAAAAANAVAAA